MVGGKEAAFDVPDGASVGDVLNAIVKTYPEMREHLIDVDGSLSRRANLFVDGRALRFLPAGLETPLEPEQELDCFQAVAGGVA